MQTKPNRVEEHESHAAVRKHWKIDEIRPADIHDNLPEVPGMPFEFPPQDRDERNYVKVPAHLLTTHKAG